MGWDATLREKGVGQKHLSFGNSAASHSLSFVANGDDRAEIAADEHGK